MSECYCKRDGCVTGGRVQLHADPGAVREVRGPHVRHHARAAAQPQLHALAQRQPLRHRAAAGRRAAVVRLF